MGNFLVTLTAALGLVLILEGLPYFATPRMARRVALWASRLPDGAMRLMGIAMIGSGLVVLYALLRGGWQLS